MWDKYVEFNELLVKVFMTVSNINDHEIKFVTEDDQTYRMLHMQDCCEDVYIESVVGDLIATRFEFVTKIKGYLSEGVEYIKNKYNEVS